MVNGNMCGSFKDRYMYSAKINSLHQEYTADIILRPIHKTFNRIQKQAAEIILPYKIIITKDSS